MKYTNFKRNFVFVWLFLMTLNSYYFYELGLPLFSVIGALLSIPLMAIFKIKLKRYHSKVIGILIYIVIISVITALFNTHLVFLSRLFLMLILLPVILVSCYLFEEDRILLMNVLRSILVVHLVFFFIQFIIFYSTGTFIDYLMPITGESQRALGGSYEINNSGSKLIRATGLFNEPGTFATFMMLLFTIYKTLSIEISGEKVLKMFDYFVILSVFLCFSVFGFIFCIVFLLSYLIKLSFKNKVFLLLLSLPILKFVYDNYLSVRFGASNSGNTGIGFRDEAIQVYKNNASESFFNLAFGFSSYIDKNQLFNSSLAWNDVGLVFSILVDFGIIGLLFFILLLLPHFKYKFVTIIILFLCKLSLTTIFLWFCLSFMFYRRDSYVGK